MNSDTLNSWISEITDIVSDFEAQSNALWQTLTKEALPVSGIQYHVSQSDDGYAYEMQPTTAYSRENLANAVTARLKDDKPGSSHLYGVGCTQLEVEQIETLNAIKRELKKSILAYREMKNGKRGRISTMARSLIQDKSVPAKVAKTRSYAADLLNAYDLLVCYAPLHLVHHPVRAIAFSWQKQPAQVTRTNVNEVLAVAQKQSSHAVRTAAEQTLQGYEGHRPLAIKRVVGAPRLYANIRYDNGQLEKQSVRSFLLLHQQEMPAIRWPPTLPQEELTHRTPSTHTSNGVVADDSLIDALNVYEYSREPKSR